MSHPPFGRRHKPTLGKSHIWLGSLRCWDLGLMPFGWPVGDTKQYPLKPPSSDCAGGGVRTGALPIFRSHDSSPSVAAAWLVSRLQAKAELVTSLSRAGHKPSCH